MAEITKSYVTVNGEERIPKPQEVCTIKLTSVTSDGVTLTDFKDNKTILYFSGTGTAIIKAGNSFAGKNDLEVVGASTGVFVAIDSARFMDKETGAVTITLKSGTISVGALETR